MSRNIVEQLRSIADKIEREDEPTGHLVEDFRYGNGTRVELRQDGPRLYVAENGEEYGYIYWNQLKYVASDDGYPPCKQ